MCKTEKHNGIQKLDKKIRLLGYYKVRVRVSFIEARKLCQLTERVLDLDIYRQLHSPSNNEVRSQMIIAKEGLQKVVANFQVIAVTSGVKLKGIASARAVSNVCIRPVRVCEALEEPKIEILN
ncbi:20474_t:CDS:2, partial [Cetraspora pellucida]